ncbi:hypothetical protein BKA70DRAFT_1562866 [Coprinopsis sp. MPI-PUGE-AT-0042]|nr:hypothetical protein BKA70DRAFT_1562866 [Coprinopsis sp. MPI-PUGE-AT-0042]
MPTDVHPLATPPLPFVSLSTSHTPTSAINQSNPNGLTFSYFLRLSKQPTPAYHYAVAPPTLPSLTNALNLTIHAHDEWINDVNFEIEQETGFRDKPHIHQTKKRKGIVYTMRVFLTIPKIQASRPRWYKGHMWAGGGHGGGDEEDEEDNRRQRAHWNTPDSCSGLVTREGGDRFTGRRAQAKSASQFPTLLPTSTGGSYDNDVKDLPHLSTSRHPRRLADEEANP